MDTSPKGSQIIAVPTLRELTQRIQNLEDSVGELQDVLERLIEKVGLEPLESGADMQVQQ